MENKDLEQLLEKEGYVVKRVESGELALINFEGGFIDSHHKTEQELEEYVDRTFFEYWD